MKLNSAFNGIIKTLGPGLLFAGAAIGGSHLVQSTRAGADYGFTLAGLVIVVLVLKYPFFEFSHRYTIATRQSILLGYFMLGRGALAVFFALAILASIFNAAAVTLVTAGLAGFLFKLSFAPVVLSALVILMAGLILIFGKYPALDKIMKYMLVVLATTTIVAVIVAIVHGPVAFEGFKCPEIWNLTGISFLLALMGWMPAPIDVSVWPSLWRLEHCEQTRYQPCLKESGIDFNLGYIITGCLALAFLSLGALVMFGTGEEFSNSGVNFAHQLVGMYTKTIGNWSWPIISLAVFFTMFSTTLAVLDGYTRTLKDSLELLVPVTKKIDRRLYFIILSILAAVALLIIGLFLDGIKTMVDVATTLAFLAAPPLAYLNYRVVTCRWVPREYRPGLFLKILSWAGIIFLTGFSLVFVYWRFFY